jgi:hypothetical protein
VVKTFRRDVFVCSIPSNFCFACLRKFSLLPRFGAKQQGPKFGDRRTHDAAQRLCHQPVYPQAYRGGLRLDQDSGWSGEDPIQRRRPRRLCLHLRRRRLQSRTIAEAPGGGWLMARVPASPRPLPAAGGSSRWVTGTTTSSTSSAISISTKATTLASCRTRLTSSTAC